MKILHLASGNQSGGAFKGTLNLHNELLKKKIQSYILNDDSNNNYKKIKNLIIPNNVFDNNLNKLYRLCNNLPKIIYSDRTNEAFSNSLISYSFSGIIKKIKPDIIHIHWIGNSLSNFKYYKSLNIPIVWTLRDMWAFTGGCHYTLNCKKYKKTCNKCPKLGSNLKYDLSTLNQKIKFKSYEKIKFITISAWLKNEAKKSKILKKFPIEVIHNTVDNHKFFYDLNKTFLNKLNILKNKKILLFGANFIDAKYKGLDFLLKILKNLDHRNYFLIFFGKFDNHKIIKQTNFEHKILGYIKNPRILRTLYSISDVFLSCSIQEAFGKTALEALMCGTPVICFENTGTSEIITHKKNGYCAKYLDEKSFINGIKYLVSKNKKELMKKNNNIIFEKFSLNKITNAYINKYKELLKYKN